VTTHSRQGDEAREGVVLPSNGEPWIPGRGDSQVSPPAGQPWGQPWGPESPPGQPAAPAQHAPQPQQMPPHAPQQPPAAGAVPGAADETQLLPPMAPTGPAGPAGPGDDATRVLRPVSGATPERDTESTTLLRRPLPPEGAPAPAAGSASAAPAAPRRAAPPPPAGAPYGIRPGTPADRPPHADFEGLFRSPGAQPADATQQLPPYNPASAPPPAQPAPPPYGGGHGGPGGPGRSGRSGGRRGLPRAAVVGIVVAGCAVAGLAAGAALSGGDDDRPAGQRQEAKASPSAPDGAAPSPSADPAEAQAKELDKLLADSNNSRTTVIRSVENIRQCKNLAKAATDLRDAARQRNDLVTRLGQIEIDELPNHQALADSLTKAWKASAAADNHYAAWADQVAGKKGCHKGKARNTGQTAQGNRASGEATAAKKQAAGLWNPTARQYGLPERQFSEL